MMKKEYSKPAVVAKAIDTEPMLAGSGPMDKVQSTMVLYDNEENEFAKQNTANTVNTVWDD
ncbi:hypothetical protein AAAT34_11575 [Hallella faecis]|uniref:Lasso RiPP family leader peptide-containing protein n=1 Tax=Hallella faecis TaxID=2841596 RepID=A0ABV1FTC9_9BACT|nr:hypothetical protein [Hallella faecis]MBU0290904.1 hypothetical protein [Hallella faecis]